MTDSAAMKQEFEYLAGEAAAGRLLIDDGVAERCAKFCDDYVNELRGLSDSARFLVRVDSFGLLNSAKALAQKFADLATGGAGTGSYQESVGKHIEVIQQMADMFRKAGEAYKAADHGTQQAITRVGDQV
ncbi:hypothetical protein [Nocardia amamiensis]|uniref:hypothetical protein n=1 Tax=Nocardia amamiensis TaxID=404578 RepID=UPI0033CBB312